MFCFAFCNVIQRILQPVKYNLAAAREVVKDVYAAKHLESPCLGHTGCCGRAFSVSYWPEDGQNGELPVLVCIPCPRGIWHFQGAFGFSFVSGFPILLSSAVV